MSNVISMYSRNPRPAIQVSCYPQRDGSDLFCVEILHADGTWDNLDHSGDRTFAYVRARVVAESRGIALLPDSEWPTRSSAVRA